MSPPARRRLAAAVLVLACVPARAGLFGRSKVASRWTVKTVAVNGDDSEWDEEAAFEEDGLAVFAMNDAKSLYLLITAHTRESRDILSGESHQDLTLWFAAADGKTRRWGARIPFGRRSPLTAALRDPAGLDPEPEFLEVQGPEISSGSLPGDVLDRLAAVGRRPIWELKVPLKRLEIDPVGGAAVDFVVNAPAGGAKRRAKAPTPDDNERAVPDRARGKRGEAAAHPEELVWDALSYSLSIRLARDPALPP